MDDDDTINPLGLPTTNYGWTKPTVGADVDVWGGYLNADLDGIDTTVKSVSNVANAAYPASNPSGYQTAANVTASLGSYLALAGGTMTGAMTLVADPAANLQPATKQYVDGGRLGDNRLINGDMRIDQRNNGASGTANGYTVDRWQYISSQAGKGTWQRNTNGPPGIAATGCGYNLGFTSSSAYTAATAETFAFYQPIEADAVSDLAWGTSQAQPATLSFWVYSSLAGTFSGSLRNYPPPATRSYPFSFLISANIWTKVAITIPGDTAGTWVMNTNAAAFALVFDLGSGATLRGAANAWASANLTGVTGAVSVVATNAATFFVTGVKLEIGSVVTPFNRQSLSKSMADCQRYYQQIGGQAGCLMIRGNVIASGQLAITVGYPAMRAAPTATVVGNFTATNTGPVTLTGGQQSVSISLSPGAVGNVSWFNTDATGLITLNAEL